MSINDMKVAKLKLVGNKVSHLGDWPDSPTQVEPKIGVAYIKSLVFAMCIHCIPASFPIFCDIVDKCLRADVTSCFWGGSSARISVNSFLRSSYVTVDFGPVAAIDISMAL